VLIEIFILIVIIAFICEFIDSSLGMGYGTILSPTLLIMGFPVLEIVPSILITQAIGGIIASISHHKHKNANFSLKNKSSGGFFFKLKKLGLIKFVKEELSDDTHTVLAITLLGVLATLFSTFVAISISKQMLSWYITILVLVMALFILLKFSLKYSSKKMVFVGIISAFNKGLSGGGFGPIVTGCQIVLGKNEKSSVACTTLSEPLICITAFTSYFFLNGFSAFSLVTALGIGAIVGGLFGPSFTKRINKNQFRFIIGAILLVLGFLSAMTLLGILTLKISL
jgi:hypothetical protein